MLRHHTEEEHMPDLGLTPAPGQSQVLPITPQELAQAIVAVETRQRADAPLRTQTITLEDTIRQLELTVTPKELLTELHTQRTMAHQKAVMTPRKTGRTLSWWLLLTGCILSTATTIFASFMLYVMLAKYNELWRDAMARNASGSAQTNTPSSKLRPLSDFLPGEQAYVSLKDLQLLSYGVPPFRIQAAKQPPSWGSTTPEMHWNIEKPDGHYLVRVTNLSHPGTAFSDGVEAEWVRPDINTGSHVQRLPIECFKNILDINVSHYDTPTRDIENVLLLRDSK